MSNWNPFKPGDILRFRDICDQNYIGLGVSFIVIKIDNEMVTLATNNITKKNRYDEPFDEHYKFLVLDEVFK